MIAMTNATPNTRIAIYLGGGRDDHDRQRDRCLAAAAEHGWDVVTIAHDPPGQRGGWVQVMSMQMSGLVDRVVVADRHVILSPVWLVAVDEMDDGPERRARRLR